MEFKDDIDSSSQPRKLNCNYVFPDQLRKTNQHNTTLLSFNIRSMKTNFDSFRAEFSNFSEYFDVLGFCETHLTDDTQKLYMHPEYNFYSTNMSNSKGGVCLYVR